MSTNSTTTTTAAPEPDPIDRGDAAAQQLRESQIQTEAKLREQTLRKALAKLENLKEQADWFGQVTDMWSISSFDAGDSNYGQVTGQAMGESRCLIYPGATAAVYINETEFKMLRARSRAFAIRNPYWLGVQHNRITYTVGTGHTWTVTAKKRNDPKVTPELLEEIQAEIDEFCKVNRYPERQEEKLTRKDRDGEYFLRFFSDHKDGVLRVRFVEPLLVWTPPGKGTQDDVWFGIQFKGDYEDPQGYYIRPANYLGSTQAQDEWSKMVPVKEIQHRKANVDLSSPRGLPTTFAVQARCEQAIKTLSNMGALVEFRAKIALIRKHVNAVASTIKTSLLNRSDSGENEKHIDTLDRYPRAAVLDVNDQVSYEFPTAQTEVDKIVASIQAELRAVAAALGLAEYMVSADASNAAFASTMVAEGPVVKTFEKAQARMIEEDIEVLERVIQQAIDKGRLDEGTLDLVNIDAEPPVIVSRDRMKETQADEILNRNHVMSRKTWAARAGLDGEQEQEEIEQERDEDAVYGLDDLQGGAGGVDANGNPIPGQPGQAAGQGQRPGQDDGTGLPTSLKPDPATVWLQPTKEDVSTIIEVPDIRQPDHFSCGACASMACGRYFGVGPNSIAEWKHALGTDAEKSTDPTAIVAYLASLGLQVDARNKMAIDDLDAAFSQGKPVIICCQDYGPNLPSAAKFPYGHYLTLIGHAMGYIYAQDSSEDNVIGDSGSVQKPGRVMIAEADFDKIWHDRDEAGNVYDHYGIEVGPKTAVTTTAVPAAA